VSTPKLRRRLGQSDPLHRDKTVAMRSFPFSWCFEPCRRESDCYFSVSRWVWVWMDPEGFEITAPVFLVSLSPLSLLVLEPRDAV
jgi:hypothetical protein